MRVAIKKWGNSASVRIPGALMAAAQLRVDQPVDVREENGRLIIEPVRPVFDLPTLLSGITDENLHATVDMGAAVGKESW